ncbi:Bet v I domain [Macleaya cordata]|uniref:Bet v I domain n=1 Tax=Macleaya cordata TaxID=56857 RepID=A0A200QR39_MACCD|nr:Bet v I domain [Macleaya cordata]
MGVISVNEEISCSISPARMFSALILDAHNLMPKLLPQVIKSIEPISGEGGPGSIEQMNFTDASPIKFAKHRLDAVDQENFHCKYTMIESDALGEKLEFIAYEVKFEASADGGCTSKMTTNYHTKGDAEMKEEEINAGKEKSIGMYKIVEAYLTENPHVYA